MFRLCILFGSLALTPVFAGLSPADHQTFQTRPIPLGVSGGNFNDAGRRFCCGGTLGCLVEGTNGTLYILSNNHVLSMSNFGTIGGLVVQPALIDADCFSPESDSVGTLSEFETMIYKTKKIKWRNVPTNLVDAAIAQITPGKVRTDGSILEIGQPGTETVEAFVGMGVKKSGRTTGLTHGTVAAVDVTFFIAYSSACGKKSKYKAFFDHQISITPASFSEGGDSGSLIVEDVADCPRPVGLLFGGGRSDTVANRIDDVLTALNVSIVGCSASIAARHAPTPLIPGATADSIEKARAAKRKHLPELTNFHSVTGVGLGRSATDPTQPVIKIFVERDTPGIRRLLPQDLDGVPVEVVESGKLTAR